MSSGASWVSGGRAAPPLLPSKRLNASRSLSAASERSELSRMPRSESSDFSKRYDFHLRRSQDSSLLDPSSI